MPSRPPRHQPIVWRPPVEDRDKVRGDPYYQTAEWKQLRAACLSRDNYRCRLAGPNCETVARIAHHVIARAKGGLNVLANLLSSCGSCHNGAHPEKGRARQS